MVLEKIIEYTRKRVEHERKELVLPRRHKERKDFRENLEKSVFSIIAEYKPSSPSGVRAKWDYLDYVFRLSSCASAFSVLTEPKWFKGSYNNLVNISRITEKPILMKDFILDTFQIEVAWAIGADAVLLMLDVLGEDELGYLARYARSKGLQTLVEVSSHEDAAYLDEKPYVDVLGINSRDFKTLTTDINRLREGARVIKRAFPLAESGVKRPKDAFKLGTWGFRGALVGTALMESSSPMLDCLNFKVSGSLGFFGIPYSSS